MRDRGAISTDTANREHATSSRELPARTHRGFRFDYRLRAYPRSSRRSVTEH